MPLSRGSSRDGSSGCAGGLARSPRSPSALWAAKGLALLGHRRTADGDFVRWGLRALVEWQPTPLAVPVFHIHGTADRLIPNSGVDPTAVVNGGGHVLPLSHADQVTAFITESIKGL